MDNAQQSYNSANMPVGTRTVDFYRNISPPTPAPFPLALPGGNTGAGASAASNAYCTGTATHLGAYNLESLSWNNDDKKVRRMKPVGADGDFTIIRAEQNGNCIAQLAINTTPLLRGGDYFELSPGYQKDGATALPLQRFVVVSAKLDESEGTPKKMSLSLTFDRDNSDTFWQS